MGNVITSLFHTQEREWSYPAIKTHLIQVTGEVQVAGEVGEVQVAGEVGEVQVAGEVGEVQVDQVVESIATAIPIARQLGDTPDTAGESSRDSELSHINLNLVRHDNTEASGSQDTSDMAPSPTDSMLMENPFDEFTENLGSFGDMPALNDDDMPELDDDDMPELDDDDMPALNDDDMPALNDDDMPALEDDGPMSAVGVL